MIDKSQKGTTALLEQLEVANHTGEVIFPAVDSVPAAVEKLAKVIRADEAQKPESEVVGEKRGAKDEKPVPVRKGRPLIVAVLVFVALGITTFIYLRSRPQPVPAPSVDLHAHNTSQGSEVPEAAFRISHEKQQLIGVQYGTVGYQNISKALRAVGKVAYDETKITRINPKFEGWIETVYVDFTGKLVQKGQPLLSIYSPDLVQTQQEYLLALKGRRELGESPFREAVSFSESLVQSARRRLELWDVSDQQIRELENRGTASRAMTIYAPASGFVMTRNAFPRQRVMPDTELYTLGDLSTVWIIADIYEFEAAGIKLGQLATVTFASFPDRRFSGKVTYIFPQVDNETRTLKVRIELANKGFALKADMFADVVLQINYGSKLVVPQEAVMDSGAEQLVYVSLDDGYFEPRKIQVGAKVDDKYIVLNGLRAGERIVTSGNFLIDSESKLKSAAGGMGAPAMDHGAHK